MNAIAAVVLQNIFITQLQQHRQQKELESMSETKPATRIYRTHDKLTGDVTFCRARNPAQAINYVTRDRFSISVATTDDVLGVPREQVLDATKAGGSPRPSPSAAGEVT